MVAHGDYAQYEGKGDPVADMPKNMNDEIERRMNEIGKTYTQLTEPHPDGVSAYTVQVGGDHYKDMVIQPAEYCIRNNLPWAEGTIVKYVSRWRKKGGIEDLKKARHILDMLIENENENPKL